jgi:hypothetical protein
MYEWEGDRHFHRRGDTENPHEALLQPLVGMVANVAYTKTADMLAPVRCSPVLYSTAINQRICDVIETSYHAARFGDGETPH